MKIWHPWQLKKLKSWGPFLSYQLNSNANPAHLPQNWAKLAVLFSWQLQNGSQDFNFFNCHGCRLFILCEIHCNLSSHIFWVYYGVYFSLSQSERFVCPKITYDSIKTVAIMVIIHCAYIDIARPMHARGWIRPSWETKIQARQVKY